MTDDQGGTELEHELHDVREGDTFVEEEQLNLEFSGDAHEYFRIWIVNLCLTLLTLGLFSAWAKVRKKRYLYAHTFLDGSPFQYLGKPLPILKGRLLGAALAVIWYTVLNFEPLFSWVLFIPALILLPWIAVRSAAFNARYSAYRNMTFHFGGSYKGFVKRLIRPVLLTVVTCGLYYAWLRAKFNRYMISSTSFGGISADFEGSGGSFFSAYVISGAAVGIVVAVGTYFMTSSRSTGHIDMRNLQKITYATYAVYFVAFIYLKSRITNLVWSGTRLGGIRFESNLRFRELLWIYTSNSVAIVVSAGLLTPWAVMRVARYRAKHFEIWTEGSWLDFEGSDHSTVQAAGAEVGELFDLDVAL